MQRELNGVSFNFCLPLKGDARPTWTRLLCDEVRDLDGIGQIKRPLGINAPDRSDDPAVAIAHRLARQVQAFSRGWVCA